MNSYLHTEKTTQDIVTGFMYELWQSNKMLSVYLQIRNSSCSDDAKHHYEHSTHYRCWDSGEYSANFTQHTHEDHQDPTDYYHHATANLCNKGGKEIT